MFKILLLVPLITFSQIQIGEDIDGEAEQDQSGWSVSLSSDGSVVAIGARDNDRGTERNTGHVRVYQNISGSWVQIGEDIDGESEFDFSGESISLSSDGSVVAIGAKRNEGSEDGSSSGHVRVYQNVSGSWVQVGLDIDGEEAGDFSGSSVSLSSDGSVVAIGAPRNIVSGHVRVYQNMSGSWVQIGEDIDGEELADSSGDSVSLSSDGSVVAIGAPLNDGNGLFSGHVRVYQNMSGSWVQIGEDIDGEAASDQSGYSVSLNTDGSIVAIGAINNDESGNFSRSGHVRVYQNMSGSWVQIGSDIDGEVLDDDFGWSISLSSDGSVVAIGDIKNDGFQSGNVRIYKNISGSWVQIGTEIQGEAAGDAFGHSVSLSSDGTLVAIGAPGNDGNGFWSGHARVYSIASELAILEVVEDIAGNSNGINITANQLNSITGVSGAIEGVNYTIALDNGTFVDENNPTAIEIQAIIDQVNATLGIDNIIILGFQLFPNPTKTQFTIQFENATELENVNIYNNLGQLVLTSKEATINTTKLTSGLYIVKIETNKGKGSKKLIID